MKNNRDTVVFDLRDLSIPDDYYSISQPKLEIIDSIKKEINKKGLTVRKLGNIIGMKHPQIVRVTNGENYNIETLLKILNALDLEIVIREKK
ncbi:XRE family transcriptional regulator [Paenibacillus wenxiniae]|uniref:XRE family transcriptional regulator n=1 Tax=Paenibacillus wenxiniae TaxID=1636843 RepID=A0ABW4RFB1_9BACL